MSLCLTVQPWPDMYYIIYNFLAVLLFIFVILPYFIWRYFRENGFPRRFRQSLGFIRDDEIAAVAHQNCIWIHGASVGEIVATSPLVKEIKKAMMIRIRGYLMDPICWLWITWSNC